MQRVEPLDDRLPPLGELGESRAAALGGLAGRREVPRGGRETRLQPSQSLEQVLGDHWRRDHRLDPIGGVHGLREGLRAGRGPGDETVGAPRLERQQAAGEGDEQTHGQGLAPSPPRHLGLGPGPGLLEAPASLRLGLPKALGEPLEASVQPALQDLQLPPPGPVVGRDGPGDPKIPGQAVEPATLGVEQDLQGRQAPLQLPQRPLGGAGSPKSLVLEPTQGGLRPGNALGQAVQGPVRGGVGRHTRPKGLDGLRQPIESRRQALSLLPGARGETVQGADPARQGRRGLPMTQLDRVQMQ